jgi:hypothetical protein
VEIDLSNFFAGVVFVIVFALNACAQRGSESETSALVRQKKAAPTVSNQVYRNLNAIQLRKKGIDIAAFAPMAEQEAQRVLQTSNGDQALRKGAKDLASELGSEHGKKVIFARVTRADAYFFDKPEDLLCADAKATSKNSPITENSCAGKGRRFIDAGIASDEQIKEFLANALVEIEGNVFEDMKKWYVQTSNGYTGLGNLTCFESSKCSTFNLANSTSYSMKQWIILDSPLRTTVLFSNG